MQTQLKTIDGAYTASFVAQYRLIRQIGDGSAARVYEARNDEIGKRVAIKILRTSMARRKEMVERFFNEVRFANQINHPGVVNIFDQGQTAQGLIYLVMEYIAGETLEQLLRRSGPLPLLQVLRLGAQIASVLTATHDFEIIHRDLKPSNIMLTDDPEVPGGQRVKLVDFGVAKVSCELGKEGRYRTVTGQLLGTTVYMAPEQWQDAGNVDERADVYSLGGILFEMLTGKPPFSGNNCQLMYKHQVMPLPLCEWREVIPENLAHLLQRMTAKQSNKRVSMRQVAARLRHQENALLGAGPVLGTSSRAMGDQAARKNFVTHGCRPVASHQLEAAAPQLIHDDQSAPLVIGAKLASDPEQAGQRVIFMEAEPAGEHEARGTSSALRKELPEAKAALSASRAPGRWLGQRIVPALRGGHRRLSPQLRWIAAAGALELLFLVGYLAARQVGARSHESSTAQITTVRSGETQPGSAAESVAKARPAARLVANQARPAHGLEHDQVLSAPAAPAHLFQTPDIPPSYIPMPTWSALAPMGPAPTPNLIAAGWTGSSAGTPVTIGRSASTPRGTGKPKVSLAGRLNKLNKPPAVIRDPVPEPTKVPPTEPEFIKVPLTN